MSLPKMFSYNVLTRQGSTMTFTYDGRLICFDVEQYPTIVETVSGKVYDVRQSGLVTEALPKASPEAIVPKTAMPAPLHNADTSDPVIETMATNATKSELLTCTETPAQGYSCIISADGSHLVGEGSQQFRIDRSGRLVTLVPLAAMTWIPVMYRYAHLDGLKQKRASPKLYVISPERAMLKVLSPNETTPNSAGALILTARAHPKEITCKWSLRLLERSMVIVLEDDAPAGSVCIA